MSLTFGVLFLQIVESVPFHLSNVFGSHMVLQRGRPVPIWGWTVPGMVVSATFDGHDFTTTADLKEGLWKVWLPSQPAGLQGKDVVFTCGNSTVELLDVLFGDVIFCSGQSNMEFTVNAAVNASAEVAAANLYPHVRVVSGPEQNVDTLNLQGVFNHTHDELYYQRLNWSIANNQSIGCVDGTCHGWDYSSAVCWLAIRDLSDLLGGQVPVGGISQNYGGTSIQYWMSGQATAASNAPEATQCCGQNGGASCLWNTQVAGGAYNRMLQTMVADWRARFQQPGLAWGEITLAAWKNPKDYTSFPLLRLAQANLTSLVPSAFLVSSIDCGDPRTGAVHSPYKQAVGQRAAWGLAAVSLGHLDVPYLGPSYASSKIAQSADGTVQVSFAAAGLYGKPLVINRTSTCPWPSAMDCEAFAVLSSPDCIWHEATAETMTDSGINLQPTNWTQGLVPVATRGAFGNWPLVHVANTHGIPLVPWLEYIPGVPSGICSLDPPPNPTPPPSPSPPIPVPCNVSAPALYIAQPAQGWWENFTRVSEGGSGTVAECAAKCNTHGPDCLGFHVWQPCVVGDCYLFSGSLHGFEPHPGAYAFRRRSLQSQ
eukprot:gene7384-1319_t